MSTTADVKNALERKAASPAEQTIYDLIERQRPALERVLPAAIGADRFARIVLTEVRRTPALLECSAESVLASMMLAAQLGLEPGPLGHVYLVPYKRVCTFVIGYKGYIELALRSGLVKDVTADIVYAGDEFKFRQGTRPFLDHTPLGPPGDREPTHFYAIGRLTTGGAPMRVLFPEDIEAARKRSMLGKQDKGPWHDDWAAMARKTPIRRLAALLPMTPQLGLALQADEGPPPEIPVEGAVSDPESDGNAVVT